MANMSLYDADGDLVKVKVDRDWLKSTKHPSEIAATDLEIDTAIDIANSIVKYINKDGGYVPGERNNVAVDLDIALYCLGYCQWRERDEFIEELLCFNTDQLEDFKDRNYTIDDYLEHWFTLDPLDFYVDKERWIKEGSELSDEDKVFFE